MPRSIMRGAFWSLDPLLGASAGHGAGGWSFTPGAGRGAVGDQDEPAVADQRVRALDFAGDGGGHDPADCSAGSGEIDAVLSLGLREVQRLVRGLEQVLDGLGVGGIAGDAAGDG